jgi:hypothetical protein
MEVYGIFHPNRQEEAYAICQKQQTRGNYIEYIPYILESNPHLVFATFLNDKS